MDREVEQRAAGRARRREAEEPRRPEAPGERTAEGREPEGVEDQVRPVGMKERVGDEGPDRRPLAARERSANAAGSVTRAGMKAKVRRSSRSASGLEQRRRGRSGCRRARAISSDTDRAAG